MYLLAVNMFEVSNLRHTEAGGVVLGYSAGVDRRSGFPDDSSGRKLGIGHWKYR